MTMQLFIAIVLLFSFAEILEANSDDEMLIVDEEEQTNETRLPNSHSAALVMALIFLCVFAYGAYRFCKCKCVKRSQPLTVPLGDQKDCDPGIQGLKDYIKEREEYLAIYGPKKNINSISSIVSKNEEADAVIIIPTPNTLKPPG